jgi:rhamnogalacturonyl hydrolase YesR
MVPPFIAYFGAFEHGNAKTSLLQAAYDQCRLYRNHLQDPATKLWKHIELGSWQDNQLWATGNGWAAAGMFRVHQTIRNSDVSEHFLDQQHDLLDWIEEIVEASWKYQVHNPSVRSHRSNFRPLTSTRRPLPAPSATLSTSPTRSRTRLRPP